MRIGAMKGRYHHEFNREEIKEDLAYLFEHLKKVRLKEFTDWYLPSALKMKRIFTIGDLYFNPYSRCKRRGYKVNDAMLGDQIKVHWRLQYNIGDFVMYKYFGTRRNVDIDMPFVL